MRTLNIFDLNSINFNLIPSSEDDRNVFYCKMRESVKETKKYDKDFMQKLNKYNSKNTYIEFRKEYEYFWRKFRMGKNILKHEQKKNRL